MAKRRARGDGTVYYDASRDRWIGAVTIAGRRRKVTGKDRTEARAKLSQLLAAKTTGAAVPNKRTTVGQALDAFLERDLPTRTSNGRPLAETTIARHEWAADHLRRELGTARLVELDVRAIENMLDRLARPTKARAGMSRGSQQKILSTLQLALDFAMQRGEVVANVARSATVSPQAARPQPRRALAPEQARTLLAALHDERNGAMFAMQLLIGLRPGEAAGLYWSDVAGAVVNITRGVRVVHGRATVVEDLKTETARRTIEMPPELVDMLARHRSAQIAERLAAPEWIDERLVFTSPTGNVLSPPNVRRQLAALCDAVEVPRISPNELRHSCASLLSDVGVPNERIADLLGHTTTRMVDQTYRHRLRPVVDAAVVIPFPLSTSDDA